MNRDFRGDRNARPDFPGFGPGLHGFGPRGFAGGFGAGFPGGFDPRGARMGRRGKGDVRTAIMALLAEQTGDAGLNGYTFMKTVAERTGGAWSPSPGSVYPTLQQLVDEGLIAASGGGRTTEYRLTDDGRAYAEEHAEQLGAWDQAERRATRHARSSRAWAGSWGYWGSSGTRPRSRRPPRRRRSTSSARRSTSSSPTSDE